MEKIEHPTLNIESIDNGFYKITAKNGKGIKRKGTNPTAPNSEAVVYAEHIFDFEPFSDEVIEEPAAATSKKGRKK